MTVQQIAGEFEDGFLSLLKVFHPKALNLLNLSLSSGVFVLQNSTSLFSASFLMMDILFIEFLTYKIQRDRQAKS